MTAPAAPAQLLSDLEAQYGLRNVRPDWLRLRATFTAPRLHGPVVNTDVSTLTHGALSWQVASAHDVLLGSPVLAQVEDAVTLSNADPRAPRGTTLALVLSDGGQEFVGVEHLPLRGQLSSASIPGTKLRLAAHARVRRGRVLLAPNCVKVLGAPPANVWGSEYVGRTREALARAGLPVPNASTFDAIAAQGPDAPAGGDELPTMGGLAGVEIAAAGEQGPEDAADEDAFWLQAAAAADAQIAALAPPAASQRRATGEMPPPPVRSQRTEPRGRAPAEDPEDVIMDSEDDVPSANVNADAQIPALDYLDDKDYRKTDQHGLHRAFALRCRMQGDEKKFTLRMTIDDGTDISELMLGPAVTASLTGGRSAGDIVELCRDEAAGKQFKADVRGRVRGMHGFLAIEGSKEGPIVAEAGPTPPGGMVCTLSVALSLWQIANTLPVPFFFDCDTE